MSKRPQVIIILGMHRSGTSALCELLSRSGATLSNSLLPTIDSVNSHGFFEDSTVVAINELILTGLGRCWYELTDLPNNWVETVDADLVLRARRLVEQSYATVPLSLLKDPRLCLLLPFWSEIFSAAGIDQKIIISYREAAQVAASLESRDGIPKDLGVFLWLNYTVSALNSVRSNQVYTTVDYQNILDQPLETLAAIVAALHLEGLDVSSKVVASVDSNQQKWQQNSLELSSLSMLQEKVLAVSRCFSSSGAGQIESVVDDWMCLHKEYSAWVLALNETLCRLISTNTHLHELGEQYGHAQSVVSERDQQIAERDVTLLGRINRKILGAKITIIDVIIPVYSGREETIACFESVFKSNSSIEHEIVVVYDCGPDSVLFDYLVALSKQKKVTLLTNDTNLGFVASVNRGMKLHIDRDVVLLNSDTIVANNWLDRMASCVASDSSIATATPFSNNAEICSFPALCRYNDIPKGWSTETLDLLFSTKSSAVPIDIPTGVGFCMYITRHSLNEAGFFDEETFGRGYGEENDFCQRVAKLGYRNVLCTDTYVFHAGGVSFGEEKSQRVAGAMRLIDGLYPDYHQQVSEHIIKDPARIIRHKIILEMVRETDSPVVLHVNHKMGGGTGKHVDELSMYLEGALQSLVLMPITETLMALEISSGEEKVSLQFDLSIDSEHLGALLKYLGLCRIHYHHLLGVSDFLMDALRGFSVPHDVTLHDYYFINANPTLINSNAYFCADLSLRDEECAKSYAIPGRMSAEQWRSKAGRVIYGADRVISPSQYVIDLYRDYFPEANYIKTYHPDFFADSPYPPVVRRPEGLASSFKILVLGALSREKGADLLEATAKLAKQKNLPYEFHLLGYAYRELSKPLITHGGYQDVDLATLIKNIGPDVVWFPCHWPETYSYTLSAAMREGLAVVAPNIGSFPERLAGRPWSWLMPWDSSTVEWIEHFSKIHHELAASTQLSQEYVQGQLTSCFYKNEYLSDMTAEQATGDDWVDIDELVRLYGRSTGSMENLSAREKVLLLLFKVRKLRVVHRILRVIPFEWQRRFKRFLSRRPMHEITK